MKIKRVRIENFRCLHKVDVSFDEITSFIGPTGVGKSTVLRALDWFFNGEKEVALDAADTHSAAEGSRISVEVEFGGLTDLDREVLGRYAPEGAASVSIWRTWDNGSDKITGKALAYRPFEEVRRHTKAMDKRRAYNALRESQPELGLPVVGKAEAVDEEMTLWEASHRDSLTAAEVEDTHFFGFAGQSRLATLIDFVFISADLRAYEETDDRKTTALGQILDHAIDRSGGSDQLGAIEDAAHEARSKVHAEVFGPTLDEISSALSRELGQLTTGRHLVVSTVTHAPKPARTSFQVSVRDGAAETTVDRQGHGFQRALIIAALKLLAERRTTASGTRTLCLAIEEPELFQHPPQSRTFADVLRKLVGTSAGDRTQIMYATHSPVFIDARNYHQIRRLSRDRATDHPATRVHQVSESDLVELLSGVAKEATVKRIAGATCSGALAEGFFSHAAVVVEGPSDEAVILGCADRLGVNLGALGITIVIAGSKSKVALHHGILTAFGVPAYAVFDADSEMLYKKIESVAHLPDENRRAEKVAEFENQARTNAVANIDLLRYLGGLPIAEPLTTVEDSFTVFADTLETYLANEWPAWAVRRTELIKSGLGFEQKDPATYREATLSAKTEPPMHLAGLLETIQRLVD